LFEIKNLFAEACPSDEEFFEVLAQHRGNSQLKRIISAGHTSPQTGWYCQDFEEWVCVLQGEAELTILDGKVSDQNKSKVEASTIRMRPGDFLTIPAKLPHKVSFTSTEPKCIWLALYME
jgi:cupin 2 domain-containing protein